jgi:predicted nucleic-acid-binding protein
MVLFDTNAILRYILQDNAEMAAAVKTTIAANLGRCMIPVEVVAEMVYVLSKVYQVERAVIAQTIEGIGDIDDNLLASRSVVIYSLQIYAASNLDFVDCLLAGYAKIKGYSVFTFDKQLKKHLV